MRFGKDPSEDDLGNKTFADLAREHFKNPDKYTDEDFAEAKENLKQIDENVHTDLRVNALELDKHIVWLSGGALVLLANMSLSENFEKMEWRSFIVAAFFSFGISIISVVTSYRKSLQSLSYIPKAQHASSQIMELMRDLKSVNAQTSEEEKESMRQKFEERYGAFKNSVKKGQSIEKCLPFYNFMAYWGFIIGLGLLMAFGFVNMF